MGLVIQANGLWLPSNLPKLELQLPDVLFRGELLRLDFALISYLRLPDVLFRGELLRLYFALLS